MTNLVCVFFFVILRYQFLNLTLTMCNAYVLRPTNDLTFTDRKKMCGSDMRIESDDTSQRAQTITMNTDDERRMFRNQKWKIPANERNFSLGAHSSYLALLNVFVVVNAS